MEQDVQDLQLSHLLTKPIAATLAGLRPDSAAKELRAVVLAIAAPDRRTPANYFSVLIADESGALPAFIFAELRARVAEGDVLYLTEFICKRYREKAVLYQTKLSRLLVVGRYFLAFSDDSKA